MDALARAGRAPQGKALAFLALVAAGGFWGMGFPLGKMIMAETDAAHVVMLRFTVAALAAAPFALRNAATRRLFRSPVILFGGALYGLAFLVQFEGLARTSVTLSALLVGAMPAFIAVSARLLGETVSRVAWIGVAAATLGAAIIAGKPDGAGSVLGVVLALSALLVFLAWLHLVRRAPPSPAPLAVTAATIMVALATVAPIAFVMHGPPNLALSPMAWAGVIGQGVLATLLATAAWQYGAARLGSATAGVFINMEPLIGAAIGVALFGDHLTPALGIGGALIITGSLAVVLGEPRPPAEV
ncbi:DMT family transporter [Phenylobacterium immobile]|uniref:DMT family transporter n=1 Tax=Phenylobacterium immobile TaxID=21 RepID=UPI000B059AF9|nr:EamA family transporter [Phenylobacterium immobile]